MMQNFSLMQDSQNRKSSNSQAPHRSWMTSNAMLDDSSDGSLQMNSENEWPRNPLEIIASRKARYSQIDSGSPGLLAFKAIPDLDQDRNGQAVGRFEYISSVLRDVFAVDEPSVATSDVTRCLHESFAKVRTTMMHVTSFASAFEVFRPGHLSTVFSIPQIDSDNQPAESPSLISQEESASEVSTLSGQNSRFTPAREALYRLRRSPWIQEAGYEIAPFKAVLRADEVLQHTEFMLRFPPSISNSPEGEVVIEWRTSVKSLTFFVTKDQTQVLKAWGTDMDSEMEISDVTIADAQEAARWLQS